MMEKLGKTVHVVLSAIIGGVATTVGAPTMTPNVAKMLVQSDKIAGHSGYWIKSIRIQDR